MSEPVSFRAADRPCQVHKYHWPPLRRTVRHHVVPLSWGGVDDPANVVVTCDTGHYSIHELLDGLRAGKPPRGGTRQERRYASRGYEEWLRSQPGGGAGLGV